MKYLFENNPKKPFILASGSSRRRELLESLGITFSVIPSDIDEEQIQDTPAELVRRLAVLKAKEVGKSHPDSWVLGGDTLVSIDGGVLGKPKGEQEAISMVTQLSGRVHSVFGGVALYQESSGYLKSYTLATSVEFVPLTEETVKRYIAVGESLDKAGAYAIQGAALPFVKTINGSFTNVVGLDLQSVTTLLQKEKIIQWR